MAVVFKAVSFGSAGRKRQNRIQAIQRLHRTLFVDTKHCGVERRLEVQADDVSRLLFKPGRCWPYSGAVDGVGFRRESTPELPDCAKRPDAQKAFACSNESSRRGGLLCGVQNPGFLTDDLLRDNLAMMSRIQTRQAFFNKTLFSPSNEILATAFLLNDGSIRLPGRQPKDHLRTPHFSCFILREAAIFSGSRRSCGASLNLVADTLKFTK